MIIIIEGPDGSGKTTLAQRLSEQTGFPYEHRSKPKNEEERQQMLKDYFIAVESCNDLIWDRCWYSEMVYGSVMRDQSMISTESMYELERLLLNNGGGLIIHCTDDLDILWERTQLRGEDYVTKRDDLAQIKLGYETLLHDTKHLLPVVRYELSANVL